MLRSIHSCYYTTSVGTNTLDCTAVMNIKPVKENKIGETHRNNTRPGCESRYDNAIDSWHNSHFIRVYRLFSPMFFLNERNSQQRMQ